MRQNLFMDSPSDPFTCPVCHDCAHDQRTVVLEATAAIVENIKQAAGHLIDAMEADGPAVEMFEDSMVDYAYLQTSLEGMLTYVAEMATLKKVANG